MSEPARFQHPRFAELDPRMAATSEACGGTEHRWRLLTGLAGRVIGAGAGNGRNLAHHPPTVPSVAAVEVEDRLRVLAAQAAAAAAARITVVAEHADALPGYDQSCDAAMVSLGSVLDPARTLAEIRRVPPVSVVGAW
jgi:hypothetical protein